MSEDFYKERLDQIAKMVNDRKTLREISRVFGVSKQRVSQIIHKNNIHVIKDSLVGMKVNHLEVISLEGELKGAYRTFYKCKCICGKEWIYKGHYLLALKNMPEKNRCRKCYIDKIQNKEDPERMERNRKIIESYISGKKYDEIAVDFSLKENTIKSIIYDYKKKLKKG